MTRQLRPYQSDALLELREAVAMGCKRIVLALPTGGGKTVIAGGIVDGVLRKGKRVLFTVPAIQLVDQTVQSFWAEGFQDIGVIQANHHMTDWSKPVQVASIQTLVRRDQVPQADVIVIDECHRKFDWYAKSFTDDRWREKPIIGLSATPWTKGLGQLYTRLIIASTTRELIEQGFLSGFRVFAPSHPDLSEVRTVAGDYHEGELSAAMSKQPLIADIVDTWQSRGEDRPTFVFGVDCAHAKHLQEKFTAAGVATGYIDADTPLIKREQIRNQFHRGTIRVVCSVGCLTTGIDWDVRCIVLARPTKSEMLYVQMIGRGLRTAPGKPDCLILDHSDTTMRLGFVTDIHHDRLHDGKQREKASVQSMLLPKECPACAYLKPPKVRKCPACGFETAPQNKVKVVDGELKELTAADRKKELSSDDRKSFFAQLRAYGESRGYSAGWASHQYMKKFGRWPRGVWKHEPTETPTPTVLNWIRSRQIALAKSNARSSVYERSA